MTDKEKQIAQILKEGKQAILKNIKLLHAYHLEKAKINTCLSCPSSVGYMIRNLKYLLNMSQFKLKKDCHYRFVWGGYYTIYNDALTDEQAIAFLKEKPSRIELFAKYPSNWEKLIGGDEETEEQRQARLAAEAEAEAAKQANGSGLRAELEKMKLKELREKYPDIKATAVKDFINKVIEAEK